MSLKLTKDSAPLNLMKVAPSLSKIAIGAGWEMHASPLDIDISIFALSNGRAVPSHVIFFNQLKSTDGSIVHSGDNRTGAGDGDDETILVDLPLLERSVPEITELSVVATIHDAIARRQTFGMLSDAYVRIVNSETGDELCSYDLDASFTQAISVQLGSLVKKGPNNWEFQVVGAGYADKGFIEICSAYGL
jgi:tellurium resistance protein TerD